MDAFPSLRTILDESKYVKGYETEIEQLSDDKQASLLKEENKELNIFRFTILQLYEENRKMIDGPYVAEMEALKKEIKRIQKLYNDAVLSIRKKTIKLKEKEVSNEPMPMPMPMPMKQQFRARPGDDLLTRIKSGDDLKRDAKQISEEYQNKIEEAIKEAHINEKKRIKGIEEEYHKKREEYWDNLDKRTRPYDALNKIHRPAFETIKDRIELLDNEEKTQIEGLRRNSTHVDALIRRKFIEEYVKEKANANKKAEEVEYAENSLATKEKDESNKEKEMEKKTEAAEMSLAEEDKNIYMSSIINEKITVPFNKLAKSMTRYFEGYAEKRIEGKCRNEGYVKKHSSSVLSYSTGLLNSDKVIYDVIYSVDVCYPYENMEIECKIKNITKIGIRATISELNNPIILFVSREHNPDKDFESYSENQIIKVKVLGNRFELNDEYISVIGELI
jgi:DNA-directed RNA polymerase subunit E'/Rpb7